MFHRLSTKIVLYLYNQGTVPQPNIDWCIYALENRLSSFFIPLIIFLFTLPITSPTNNLMLIFSIIAIRRYSGGYHCKNELHCFLLSLCCVLLGLSVANYLSSSHYVLICIFLLFLSYIALFLAPINLPEIHLSDVEMNRNRFRLRITSAFLLIIFLALCYYDFHISAYGIIGYGIAALSVIAAKLTQKRRRLS